MTHAALDRFCPEDQPLTVPACLQKVKQLELVLGGVACRSGSQLFWWLALTTICTLLMHR